MAANTTGGPAKGREAEPPTNANPRRSDSNRTVYPYNGEDGNPLFRVVRRPGKEFHQERRENGEWKSGLGDTPRVLYNLPAVIAAAERGDKVFITEGEDDADRLNGLGVTATCNPMGAGNWLHQFSHYLHGVDRAIIIWDNDKPNKTTGKLAGQDHALEIAASLDRVGIDYRFFRAKTGKDVSDHLDAGLKLNQLVRERPIGTGTAPTAPGAAEALPAGSNGQLPEPAVYQLAVIRLREYADAHGLRPPVESATGWECSCPAHDDRNPSMGIRVGDDHPVVVNCQAGCEWEDVADALGIARADFSDHSRGSAALEKEVQRQRNQAEAKAILAAERYSGGYVVPTTSLREDQSKPREPTRYTVDQLHVEGCNTLFVASYKSGKTTVANNLAGALADRGMFLGRYKVNCERNVGMLQYELTESMSLDWFEDQRIEHPERIYLWQLRGHSLPFWIPSVQADVVGWLQDNDIGFLIVDPQARAWSGLVESEGDNIGAERFYNALDEIKELGSVDDLLMTTHTGRAQQAEGSETARGPTRQEDWMDHGWYLTKDDKSGIRSLRAMGREVGVPTRDLHFDPTTRGYSDSGYAKKDRTDREHMEIAVDVLGLLKDRGGDSYPAPTKAITDLMKGVEGRARNRFLREAIPDYIDRTGTKASGYLHTLTADGEAVRQRRVTPK